MRNHFIGFHLDFIGFSTSLLCAVHCIALPFLLSLAPLLGLQFLENEWIELLIIATSFIIASLAISHGYLSHHRKRMALFMVMAGFSFIVIGHASGIEWLEIIFSVLGGVTIAGAHLVNWIYIRRSLSKCNLTAQTGQK